YEAKISSYGKLKSALTQFQAAAGKLSEAEAFKGVKSTVTGSALGATAGSGAGAGTFQVEVVELARASSVATAGIADKGANLGGGTIAFELGNGESFSVEIDAQNSSLEKIRDAINAADGGVRASIVNDGSGTPYRLVLAAAQTGTEGAVASVDFGDLAASLDIDPGTAVEARDASLTVNGIAISSQSNQVSDAIEGVTLNLLETGSATVTVAADTQAVKDGIKGFVTAYNNLQATIAGLTSYDAASGVAGDLLGDATLRSIQSRLRGAMAGGVGGGEIQRLADIGIKLEVNGTLKVDDAKLDAAISGKSLALTNFFAGSDGADGLADELDDFLGQILKSGGPLDNATKGLDASVKRLDERYLNMEKSINVTIARYRAQFSQLDVMIASMNSTSSYLTQQFDMLNAQLNAK
ncbi:MAG: flagellar filament capping protein FliD, partial [Porticoccaceae bacterium]